MVVIFDPEKVLTDTDACRFGAWKEMAREQGILYDAAFDTLLQGMDREARLQSILNRAHRTYSPAERMALLTRQWDLQDEFLQKLGADALRPGAEQTIRALKKRKIKLGAVMTEGLPGRVLGALPIRSQFDVISRKEDLLSQLSDVQLRLSASPGDCLLVTAYPAGAKAARSLGMQALLCGQADDHTVILQQILAIMPDFDEQKLFYGGNYAG